MRFSVQAFGAVPAQGRPLIISLHGGGGAPAQVNDTQWHNQQRLYHNVMPPGALYVCPRAPTNNWNLWHENHMDALLERLIDDCIVLHHVDADRVYLIGYSAGGDGVYKLAPRMAPAFAGASMCAGHPNGEPLLSLRNLPFCISVGAQDAAYERNAVGRQYAQELQRLGREDGKGGYTHFAQFPPTGHWMNGADAQTLTWLSKQTRATRPKKVVWMQNSDRTHQRFYWLACVDAPIAKSLLTVEQRSDNEFCVLVAQGGIQRFKLLLDDQMCQLDEPVRVTHADGRVLFEGVVPRTLGALVACLQHRGDPSMMFEAQVVINL